MVFISFDLDTFEEYWAGIFVVCVCVLGAQSWLPLCDPMDCSQPGSSIHGIFQARVLEWVAIAFSDEQPRHHIKKQGHYFVNKGPSSQGYGFSSSHVWM